MGKPALRRKTKRPTPPAHERQARETRATLERAVRQQRRIKQLAGELKRAITRADDALRSVGRVALERDDATRYRDVNEPDNRAPAAAGAWGESGE